MTARQIILSLAVLIAIPVPSLAVNVQSASDTEIAFKTEGQFTGNHPASYVLRFMMETTPNYGDSAIAVNTDVKIDRKNSKASISVVGVDDPTSRASKVDVRLTCAKFTITDQREALFMTRSQETVERTAKDGAAYKNGDVSRNNLVRADCVNKEGKKFNAMIIYDESSYTLVLNEGTLGFTNPRFDVILGPMPKK